MLRPSAIFAGELYYECLTGLGAQPEFERERGPNQKKEHNLYLYIYIFNILLTFAFNNSQSLSSTVALNFFWDTF